MLIRLADDEFRGRLMEGQPVAFRQLVIAQPVFSMKILLCPGPAADQRLLSALDNRHCRISTDYIQNLQCIEGSLLSADITHGCRNADDIRFPG
ncbi:hypothetical protein D3C81_1938810 [compost metagenome]